MCYNVLTRILCVPRIENPLARSLSKALRGLQVKPGSYLSNSNTTVPLTAMIPCYLNLSRIRVRVTISLPHRIFFERDSIRRV
jgi:hypothetical protein